MNVSLVAATARGPAERGRTRTVLDDVTLEAGEGVLAVLGAPGDGTGLLLDVIQGTIDLRKGRRKVLVGAADVHTRIARVSLDAPLPEAMHVDEVCVLAADLRDEPRVFADERLAILGASALARRTVRSLSVDERRTVTLALALTSKKVEVLLVEEPFVALSPVAPAKVAEAIRAHRGTVIVTTASARDAMLVASRFGVLTAGTYRPLPDAGVLSATMRIVARDRAAALIAALGEEVTHVESTMLGNGASAILVSGSGELARVVTRAIAATGADVEFVEPVARPLDALREVLGGGVR